MVISHHPYGSDFDLQVLQIQKLFFQLNHRSQFWGETSTIEESLVLWEPNDDVKDGQYFLVVAGFGEDGKRQEVKATVTVLRR